MSKSKIPVNKICEGELCLKPFITTFNKKVYCSRECHKYHKNYRSRVNKDITNHTPVKKIPDKFLVRGKIDITGSRGMIHHAH